MPAKNKTSSNPFDSLGPDIETKEKADDMESKKDVHKAIDDIWKLLIKNRRECRSKIYQFMAAILIEMEGLSKEDGGLEGLMESILLDPKKGDQHIAKLPRIYHEKIILLIEITFAKDKNIQGNVNKYAVFLQKWHSDLIQEIKGGIEGDYIIKDSQGNDIINPTHRQKIKEIIINNFEAKKNRGALNLSAGLSVEEKKEKSSKSEIKTGMDFYLDYLLEENEELAQEFLAKATELGYTEEIVSDEYYIKKFQEFSRNQDFRNVKKILLEGAERGSASIQHLLSDIYDFGYGTIKQDPKEALNYCQMSADQGFVLAMHDLAHKYVYGLCGLKKNRANINIGLEWFKKAAAQDHPHSLHDLANIYYHKSDITENNIPEAERLWRKAISLGFVESSYSLGVHYIETGNLAEGIPLVTEAASKGIIVAQWYLVSMYSNSVPRDLTKVIEWAEKAAAGGHKEAIKYLQDNKAGLDIVRKENQYPKYCIVCTGVSEKVAIARLNKVEELLRKIGLDNNSFKKTIRGDSIISVRAPFQSDHLTKEVREELGIDRGRFDKITLEQQELLQKKLPRATIEDDPKDASKMLITWPTNNREQDRKIVDEIVKEVIKPKPSTTSAVVAGASKPILEKSSKFKE